MDAFHIAQNLVDLVYAFRQMYANVTQAGEENCVTFLVHLGFMEILVRKGVIVPLLLPNVILIQENVTVRKVIKEPSVKIRAHPIDMAKDVKKCVVVRTEANVIIYRVNAIVKKVLQDLCVKKSAKVERTAMNASLYADVKTVESAMRTVKLVNAPRGGKALFVRIAVSLDFMDKIVLKSASALMELHVITLQVF